MLVRSRARPGEDMSRQVSYWRGGNFVQQRGQLSGLDASRVTGDLVFIASQIKCGIGLPALIPLDQLPRDRFRLRPGHTSPSALQKFRRGLAVIRDGKNRATGREIVKN